MAQTPVSCGALKGVIIPAESVGLPTTGAEVLSAEQVDSKGAGPEQISAHCAVTAVVHPLDPGAPDITISIGLPTVWSRDTVMFGGGGYNGTVPDIASKGPFGAVDQAPPLSRGYVTFGSDSGHKATNANLPTPSLDGSFGVNDEAVRNFSGDALKKTRDTALFIAEKHYGSAPVHNYFVGGSTGGREALAVAQRWPSDFNGVVSAYPAWKAASTDLWFGHAASLLSKPEAFIPVPQQQFIYDMVINTCDSRDGLPDGVISDEAGCNFEPQMLACDHLADSSQLCLTKPQLDAVIALTAPLKWKYSLESGETGIPGAPFLSGANMTTSVLGLGTDAPSTPMPPTSSYGAQFWDQWVKYFVTRDPNFDSLTIDPLDPGPWLDRISSLSSIQDVNNADLSAFAAAGGKLLLLHGTADQLVSHRTSVEYFHRVEEKMGEAQVDSFARFYLIPGADHANKNAAFAASWDSIGAISEWTRNGNAPTNPVMTDANKSGNARTRPMCEYPAWPRYSGSGDPQQATSFQCTGGPTR
ncbi:tannase/feruloyl esterase family alpha/beta hydrolase [Rhodococcus qingshengii]|nr:tannase/feruloyl esterase family alpha/beta hydrolase [Rhodococcus qingshengii]